MSYVIPSCVEAALWIRERAARDGVALPARKLQALLFLAQAHFVVGGAPLMPAVFVVDRVGPLEPNVHRLMEFVGDALAPSLVNRRGQDHLEEIWARYGSQSADELNERIAVRAGDAPPFVRRDESEVGLTLMRSMYAPREPGESGPRVMHTAGGRVVTVTAWTPGQK